jgi:hypothetical protein
VPAEYEVHILEAARNWRLDIIDDFASLHYVKRVNNLGSFSLAVGPETFDRTFAQLDGRVVVWRKPAGGARVIDFAGFIRGMRQQHIDGRDLIVMTGPSYNDALKRRVVAYAAVTDESRKADQADDMMKEIVDENLGASAPAGRDITGFGFTVQADVSAGTIVRGEFAYKNVLDTLKAISDASRAVPTTQAFFGVVPLGSGWDMEFRTNVPQWGLDHAAPGGAHGSVTFSLEYGNMANPRLEWDRHDEITVVYGGGSGEAESRPVIDVADAGRRGESILNRREAFHDISEASTTLELIDGAQARLDEGHIKRRFTFDVVEVPSTVYGLHWGFGDVVTAVYAGEEWILHVAAIEVRVEGQVESVEPRFEEFAA